ncbi:MAG: hypothetical protein ACFB4J_16890 [Elainellaceae cyanobacterium]
MVALGRAGTARPTTTIYGNGYRIAIASLTLLRQRNALSQDGHDIRGGEVLQDAAAAR